MTLHILLLFAAAVLASGPRQQTVHRDTLLSEVVASDYIHRPLPLHPEGSAEAAQARIPSTDSLLLAGHIRMDVPTTTGHRPKGSEGDPDYAIFGTVDTTIQMGGADLSAYDRISLLVFPEAKGTAVTCLNLQLNNATPAQVGAHLMCLRPNQWNHILYDLGSIPREHVNSLRIYSDIKGRQASGPDTIRYTIRHISAQRTGHPTTDHGWTPSPERISYSMSGYPLHGQKTAILHERHIGADFRVADARTGRVCLTGKVAGTEGSIGRMGQADFTALSKPGNYILEVGSLRTQAFTIGSGVWMPSMWRVLNFIFCQRCGYPVEGIHDECHTDLYADHLGHSYSYGGGWHDAGDLSQQTLQTADVAYALLESAQSCRKADPTLSQRLIEEACWGLRFVLQCRLGDGYHASSLGLLHWTDNKPGTYDDIHTVRRQCHAFDNFLYAAYEAYACRILGQAHPLYPQLRRAAEEDFLFASLQYSQQGILPFPHMMEHTYNTAPSLFAAAASWSASQMYLLTGDDKYAGHASAYIRYTLACQEKDGARPELRGYFYRDETRRAIIHFIHQSREQLLAQALVALCQSQPKSPERPQWDEALQLYAQYLCSLVPYTAPYGMASSGTYLSREYDDDEGFRTLHLFAPANAQQLYTQQLQEGGVRLDSTHYVKRFPVWFSIFNGNEAIILSTGKAAAVLGKYLHDDTLREYALAQLYWTVGRNPFAQSLIYGEGHNYPSMDSFSSGEITGEMPVGIRSWKNTDTPYWPTTNNACYKEVWLTTAGKWLSLTSEFLNQSR